MDFNDLPGEVTFPDGSATVAIVVTPIDDNQDEPDESVTVQITSNSGGEYGPGDPSLATVTIADNEPTPTVTIQALDPDASEAGPDPGTFRISRDITAGSLTVVYEVDTTSTATSGDDFSALSGSVTFNNGDSYVDVLLTPVDDAVDDPDETVILNLTANSGTMYTIGSPSSATVTIADNDVLLLTVSGPTQVDEGTEWTLTVTANIPVTNWSIDWGDGTVETPPGGSSILTLTHTYADDDPTATPQDDYLVAIQGSVGALTANDNHTITVKNVPAFIRSVNISSPPAITTPPIPTNLPVTISGDIDDPSATDFKEPRIDWGDGNEELVTLTSLTSYRGTHTYAAPGKYKVLVKVKDDDSANFSIRETTVLVDHRPVANADNYTGFAGRKLTINALIGVLTNDTDADFTGIPPVPNGQPGRAQKANLEQTPLHGRVKLTPDGSFTYIPDRGFVGNDAFYYTVSDGLLSSTPPTKVTITLLPRTSNIPPVAADDETYSVVRNHQLESVLTANPSLLDNDTDADVGDTLTVSRVTVQPSNGVVSVNADGTFTYTPKRNYVGNDSFKYRATDGIDESNEVTVSITVANGVNTAAPVGVADTYQDKYEVGTTTVNPGSSDSETDKNDLIIDATKGVLANDTDADGDYLTARIVTPPPQNSFDTFSFNPDGSFRFVRAPDYLADVDFWYRVSDGSIESPPIMVHLDFDNPPVIAVKDEYYLKGNWAVPQTLITTSTYTPDTSAGEDQDDDVPDLGVLKNDTPDVPGTGLSVILVNAPRFARSSFTLNTANGSFTYEPIANWSQLGWVNTGVDSETGRPTGFVGDQFTYKLSLAGVFSNEVTVNIRGPRRYKQESTITPWAPPDAGYVLMGGGSDVAEAFTWMIDRANGGDFVILRHGGDQMSYTDWIWNDLGGSTSLHSVETLVVDSPEAALNPDVQAAIAGAESLFIVGGEQDEYIEDWSGIAGSLQALVGTAVLGRNQRGHGDSWRSRLLGWKRFGYEFPGASRSVRSSNGES